MTKHSTTLMFLITIMLAGLSDASGQATGSGQTVRLNDIDLYYEVQGSGEPLVLLHGFGGCGRDWQPFAASLAAQYKLIIPDARGHGKSTNPSGVFTHRQAAEDIFGLMDKLGITNFKAIGISSGSMTLLHMSTRQPTRIEAMILVSSTSYLPKQGRAIMSGLTLSNIPPPIMNRMMRCASRGQSQVDELNKQFIGFKDGYDDMNFTPPFLATIKARTLIVHGDRDQFFPVSIPVEMYNAIPNSALWIVPQGDHMPILGVHTQEFIDTSLRFLKRNPSGN